MFRQSKYFTEWAASSCPLEQQAMLAELQLQLSCWERGWGKQMSAAAIERAAGDWSARLLETAGL